MICFKKIEIFLFTINNIISFIYKHIKHIKNIYVGNCSKRKNKKLVLNSEISTKKPESEHFK